MPKLTVTITPLSDTHCEVRVIKSNGAIYRDSWALPEPTESEVLENWNSSKYRKFFKVVK